jgi:hypothetical protein
MVVVPVRADDTPGARPPCGHRRGRINREGNLVTAVRDGGLEVATFHAVGFAATVGHTWVSTCRPAEA